MCRASVSAFLPYVTTLAVALMSASPEILLAQQSDSLHMGQRVRITLLDGTPLPTGTVATVGPVALDLRNVEGLVSTFRYEQIERIERRVCRWCSAGKGAAIGGVVGGAVGVAWIAHELTCDTDSCSGAYLYFGAIGAASGALIGLIVGAVASSERWEEVAVPTARSRLTVTPGPDGTIRLALRLRR